MAKDKKMKVDKEESKKKKKAKGVKGKKLKKIFIGGLILSVAIGVFATTNNNNKKDDGVSAIHYNLGQEDSYNIIIYQRGELDVDPQRIEDLYVYTDDNSNSLIYINPRNDKNITLLHGNTDLNELEKNSNKSIPLTEVSLLESIVESSDIETTDKNNGTPDGCTDYSIYLNRESLDELLADKTCTDKIDCYTTIDGNTYETLDEYITAATELQNSKSK